MKTTPLLMTGGNVRLIQQDLKTNTRRVVKPEWQMLPLDQPDYLREALGKCPYGKPGDQLAIRETFWAWGFWLDSKDVETGKTKWTWHDETDRKHPILFDADLTEKPVQASPHRKGLGYHRRPSIYLPMNAWRIKLEITRIEVERLQDISDFDAEAEGMTATGENAPDYRDAVENYALLWDSINGKPRPGKPDISWKVNPLVWSIHFKKLS